MAGSHVSAESGTGLVHTAPAHGPEDYGLFLSRGLTESITCAVDGEGRFTSDVIAMTDTNIGQRLVGKEVLWGGNKEVITILKENGHLLAEEKVKHRYPYDWKTDQPIIVRYYLALHFLFAESLVFEHLGLPRSGSPTWQISRDQRFLCFKMLRFIPHRVRGCVIWLLSSSH